MIVLTLNQSALFCFHDLNHDNTFVAVWCQWVGVVVDVD